MALDTHAAVKTLTDAGAPMKRLALAVVEVAREASTEATGALVTRSERGGRRGPARNSSRRTL